MAELTYSRILVTGATGFLGGRIVEGLQSSGAEVIATGRNTSRQAELEALGATFIAADLTDMQAVSTLARGCDLIIHCAALSSPWGKYHEFYTANVTATDNLLAAAKENKAKRFIFISTPSIYFDFRHRLDIRESDPLPNPMVNHYATTKYIAEQKVFASGLPAIALRPRAIIGRGDTVIMPRVLHAYHQNRLRCVGSGQNVVSVTPVANVVHAVQLGMYAGDQALGRAYNISGDDVKLWDLLRDMLIKLDLKSEFRRMPYPVAMTAAWLMEQYARLVSGKEPVLTQYSVGILAKDMTLNTDLARQYLGYQPIQNAQQAMIEFAEWWKRSDE